MAATVTITERYETGWGTKEIIFGTVALDNSYPTGGEALDTATTERFAYFIGLPNGTTAGGAGYKPEFNAATQSLLMFYADYDAVADGALIQVPNTTDLSGITAMPFIAIGG